jgi:Tfp pilus assembly protein PilF
MRGQGPDKLNEAIARLKWARQYDPNDPQLSLQLALCYESKEEFTDAAALLEKAVELEPDLAPAHVALARVYFRLGKKSDAQREKDTVKALQEKLDRQKMRPNPAALSPLVQQP